MYLTFMFLGYINANYGVLEVAFSFQHLFFGQFGVRKLKVAELIRDCDSVYKSKISKSLQDSES